MTPHFPPTVLVTGAAGFAGRHLLDHLAAAEPDAALHAWTRPGGSAVPAAGPEVRLSWRQVDMTDREEVRRALAASRPGIIYHCAGAAHVAGAWQDSGGALLVNALGTHVLLDAAAALALQARILLPGSALVYARSERALREEDALVPGSPYGLSKLAQEMRGRHAVREGQAVLLTRSFNHTGPGQAPSFAASSFARQVAAIERGHGEPVLRVGNLDARRDVTDVRDVVGAYHRIMQDGVPGRPYNVCSGRAVPIGDILEGLLSLARVRVEVRTDPALLRPSDTPVLLGDPGRIRRELGWSPAIPLSRTLADLLDAWRRTSD